MDELSPDDIQYAHDVLALLGFPLEVVPVFTLLHVLYFVCNISLNK